VANRSRRIDPELGRYGEAVLPLRLSSRRVRERRICSPRWRNCGHRRYKHTGDSAGSE
jgi:hypothetical protein